MAVNPSGVQYRMTQEQLNEYRDTMDALDENLRCARRCMESLNDLRDKMRTQQVGVTTEE